MSNNGTDIASILGKGLIGAIPFVGPLAAEIIGAIIPNQRIERIEALLKMLEEKISEEDRPKIKKQITKPESVDLIEDGFIQASRALSDERKDYIASLLKNSLTSNDLKHIQYKKLLSILSELNDIEILILKSYTLYTNQQERSDFWETHKQVLYQPIATRAAPQEEHDKQTVYQTHKIKLVSLGLLKARFKRPKRDELPEFDNVTGMIKAQGCDITKLGGLLLRSIDQYEK